MENYQITFEDFYPKEEKVERTKPEKKTEAPDDPNEWCLVYLVTRSGGNSGNLFILRKEDAQKLCEDECSHGTARGGQWFFMWTALSHFYDSGDRSAADRQQRNVHGKLEPFVFIKDTGKQDKDFERLGIKKPTISEMQKLLNDMGYELKYQGTKERLIEEGVVTAAEFEETEKYIAETLRNKKRCQL